MYLLIVICVILAFLAFICYRHLYAPFRIFKNLNIPHSPPVPFFGNSLEINRENDFIKTHHRWIAEYGKVYGYYLGASPTIAVVDLDIIKDITVKYFNNFMDRQDPSFTFKAFPPGITMKYGEAWRGTRGLVSPTFSSKKLRNMTPHIERICKSLNERMEEFSKSNESAELWRLFGQFTMETILATAFGRQVNVLKGEGEEITSVAAKIFINIRTRQIINGMTYFSHFPFLKSINELFIHYSEFYSSYIWIRNASLQLIKERRQQPDSSNSKDFLHLLIEAKADDNEELSSSTTKKTLTDEEIVSICVDFLLAGYETTSNCLAFTAYLLALNTDQQDKLIQSIKDFYEENEDASLYDASQEIQYLDWVISESLRMYPPAGRILRYCKETCVINGITFFKGSHVAIPIWSLHHLPEYWEEPEVFRPERFSPEEKEKRNPLCYMPFGWGPRNCIGMRFALMEAKMALVSILRKYSFQVSPDTEIPLKTDHGATLFPVNGVYLKVVAN